MNVYIAWLIVGVFIGFCIAYSLFSNLFKDERTNRKRLSGKYTEKFIPFLDKIKYSPADMYFLGMPIDYIVFNGLNDGCVKDITFLEVKTGSSTISKRENLVKEAIKEKRVKWEEVRI